MPSTSIFNVFAKSPLRMLQEHMAKVLSCVKELDPFFQAVLKADWKLAEQKQREIAKLENEADDLKRKVRLHLPKGIFLPVSRGDILALLKVQDRLANRSRDIAGLILGRKMEIPPSLLKLFTKYLTRSIEASKQANKVINELDELLETGFSRNEINIVGDMITVLADIEHDTDDMQIELRQKLFLLEEDLSHIQVIFLYKVVEWIGELADLAQAVGDELEILAAK